MPVVLLRWAAPPGLLVSLLVFGIAGVTGGGAMAQYEAPRPPDPSSGVQLGPGLFAGSIDLSWQQTSNVFRRPDDFDVNGDGTIEATEKGVGQVGSSLKRVQPKLVYVLPYSNSRLTLSYSTQYRAYSVQDLARKTDQQVGLTNELVMSNGMQLNLRGGLESGAIETSTFDLAGQIAFSTTPYHHGLATLEWTWDHPSRWGTVMTLNGETLDFQDSSVAFFDSETRGITLDGTWRAPRNLVLFVGAGQKDTRQSSRDHDRYLLDHGLPVPNRPSEENFRESSFHVGAKGPFGPRLAGEAQVSSVTISADNPEIASFRGLDLRMSLQATMTQASQMFLDLTRQPVQALINQASLFVFSSARLRWLYYSSSLQSWNASVQYNNSDLSTRVDKTVSTEGSWSYNVARRARVYFTVTRVARQSTDAAFEYNETSGVVGWTLGWF